MTSNQITATYRNKRLVRQLHQLAGRHIRRPFGALHYDRYAGQKSATMALTQRRRTATVELVPRTRVQRIAEFVRLHLDLVAVVTVVENLAEKGGEDQDHGDEIVAERFRLEIKTTDF